MTRERSTEAHGYEVELTGFKILRELTDAERKQLEVLAERLNRPTSVDALVGAIHRCLAATQARAQDGDDIKARIAVLVEDLAEYPEDVVLTAFRDWRRWQKFWPTVAELRLVCDRATRWRRSLRKAVA